MPLFTVWARPCRTHADLPLLARRVAPPADSANGRPGFASPKPSSARTGTNKVVRTPGAKADGCGCRQAVPVTHWRRAQYSARLRAVGQIGDVQHQSRKHPSPPEKRGTFSSAITGAATTMAFAATKNRVRRPCPRHNPQLKSPIGSVTTPSPCSLSVIGCACCVMILTWFTGGFPPPRWLSSLSPPKRNAASRPCPSRPRP